MLSLRNRSILKNAENNQKENEKNDNENEKKTFLRKNLQGISKLLFKLLWKILDLFLFFYALRLTFLFLKPSSSPSSKFGIGEEFFNDYDDLNFIESPFFCKEKENSEEIQNFIKNNFYSGEKSSKELYRIFLRSSNDVDRLIKSFSKDLKYEEKTSKGKFSNIPNLFFLGPPGTGKTHFAEELAKKISCGYFKVSGGSFQRIYVGTGARKLETLKKEAKLKENIYSKKTEKPVVIIIDEIDSLAGKKSRLIGGDVTLVNTFLTFIDDINNSNIVLIGTANSISNMEEAAVRKGRFTIIEFSFPEKEREIELVSKIAWKQVFGSKKFDFYSEKERDDVNNCRNNEPNLLISKEFKDKFFSHFVVQFEKTRKKKITIPYIIEFLQSTLFKKAEFSLKNKKNHVKIEQSDFIID